MNPQGQFVDILLVEDSAPDAELASLAIEQYDPTKKILHVKDGQEAIDFLKRNDAAPPKLVLLDLKMPRVDGFEVLKQMRSDERTRYIPVAVLTSSAEVIDQLKSYDSGANSYIVKPIDFQRFTEAVTVVCRYWLEFASAPVATVPGMSVAEARWPFPSVP